MKQEERRILLTGFMGAGKSTVGAALARLLGCGFADLDAVVRAREGRTPQQLIDEEGEARFREAETRALSEVLKRREAQIVALGGGTWTLERNRALASEHDCFTVWLDAPFELCWQRISANLSDRPFARDAHKARELYHERRAAYERAALRVSVEEGREADAVASEIKSAVVSIK